MKHILFQLSSDYFVILNNSKIEVGDWVGYPNLMLFVPVKYLGGGDLIGKEMKITHSTKPSEQNFEVKELSLSEIENLIYGDDSYIYSDNQILKHFSPQINWEIEFDEQGKIIKKLNQNETD